MSRAAPPLPRPARPAPTPGRLVRAVEARGAGRAALLRLALLAALLGAGTTVAQDPLRAEPPACRVDDLAARVLPEPDGRWTLLDTARRLPAEFVPPDLVPLTRAGFADQRLVRSVIVEDLAALRVAAERAGHRLEVQSAYRSFAYQERTFASWVEAEGYASALATSARAGHSEHQLGTAVDLRSAGGPAPWRLADWAETPEGAWVAEHAWRFGFVISYPRGERARSCYAYEPWHLRWVGRAMAADVHRSGRPLRALLWEHGR